VEYFRLIRYHSHLVASKCKYKMLLLFLSKSCDTYFKFILNKMQTYHVIAFFLSKTSSCFVKCKHKMSLFPSLVFWILSHNFVLDASIWCDQFGSARYLLICRYRRCAISNVIFAILSSLYPKIPSSFIRCNLVVLSIWSRIIFHNAQRVLELSHQVGW